MRYVGGKFRVRKQIADAIIKASPNRGTYIEPFVGSGSVFQEVAPHFSMPLAGDAHKDLVAMWNALLFDEWMPQSIVTEERYQELRMQSASPDRAFAGFGCSFGGKWFGGYARSGGRNYAMNMKNGLIKTKEILKGVVKERLRNQDYKTWIPDNAATIYLDPPYAGTQGYTTGQFDHKEFWSVAAEWSKRCCVIVSEYSAPEGWSCILEVTKTVHLGGGRRCFDATERLFRLNGVSVE